MASTVTKQVVTNNNRDYVVNVQILQSNTAVETATVLLDMSDLALTIPSGASAASDVAVTKFVVEKIEWNVLGMESVELLFDATTNVPIHFMTGQGEVDWTAQGGITDPFGSGATGDILFTTNGGTMVVTDRANFTLFLRKKA